MLVHGTATSDAPPTGEGSPPVESAERARQREIAAYLSAASFPPGLPPGGSTNPFINTDPTLNALVQVGALRLDCSRSFVSLIDRQYQFVVAEMTRTHALSGNKHAPGDGIHTGVAKLDACVGICPTTMKAFMDETGEWIRTGPNVIANKTRFIINDFRKDPEHMDRPYVTDHPHFTSYLEVPLISPLGYVLGTYCVVDNKLRHFDDEDTISTMNDIASTIMAHFELRRMKQERHRSQQLIEGLGEFIEYDSPVPHSRQTQRRAKMGQSTAGVVSASADRIAGSEVSASPVRPSLHGGSHTDATLAETLQQPSNQSGSAITEFSDAVSTPARGINDTPPTTPLSTVDSDPFEQHVLESDIAAEAEMSSPSAESPSSEATESHANGFIASADIKSVFFRATTTMRRTMNLDGLMFLDAVPRTFADRADQPATISPGTNQASNGGPPVGPFCAAIVQSVVEDQADETSTQHPKIRLAEDILQRFIRRFPRGHILSADEFGPIDNGYGPGQPFKTRYAADQDSAQFRNDVDALFQMLPPAKYIIFLPLWHFQRECWYAAALGWVADPTRAVNTSDLSMLSAFCNSAMAEVSRIEAIAANRAKSNFVSSISHELRSPLHGIMASSELLRDAISEPSLISILDMLDSCGSLLLDTFGNLLDHGKISNASKSSKALGAAPSLENLSELVEDVVDAVKVSYTAERAFKGPAPTRRQAPSAPVPDAELDSSDGPVLVTLNIESGRTWNVPIDNGVWKRLVMNIFSNALKYTRSGHIEVGLKMVQRTDYAGKLCNQISFSVEDTGRGMSSDFLKYQLFTPYSQEDSLAPGMGLGLSIVQQLVKSIGGTVHVKSSVGVGTSVEVLVPLSQQLDHDVSSPPLSLVSPSPLDGSHTLGELTICLITPESMTNGVQKRSAIVEKALRHNASELLGMSVVLGTQDCPLPKADFYVLDGSSLAKGLPVPDREISPLIVLCSATGQQSCANGNDAGTRSFHLHHPIGPRKLASVLSAALQTKNGSPVEGYCSTPRGLALDIPSPNDQAVWHKVSEDLDLEVQDPLSENHETSLNGIQTLSSALPSNESRHLLLVDDNPINIKLLAAFVGKLNHTYSTAADGLQAVQLYRESLERGRSFDLIFMDISMPVMDGFEATREIRRLEAEAGVVECKVAVLTGLSSEESRNEAFASGTDLFLTKPVKMDKIKKLLDEELG